MESNSSGNAPIGASKIATAKLEMPGLKNILIKYSDNKPFQDVFILGCVTPTPQTGLLILTLKELGADISWCSDNRFASDDDVVAYLKESGVHIYARSNMTEEEYLSCMDRAIADIDESLPLHIIDDGCDITTFMSSKYPNILNRAKGLTEQTTCGINYLLGLYKTQKISIPSFNIDGCFFKKWFDNFYGIQESLIHSFSEIGITIHSKKIAIFGYGAIGEGAAKALRSMGASVSIVEYKATHLIKARWDGFHIMSTEEALRDTDICLTATGCIDTISKEAIETYARDSLFIGNIGHGTSEYNVAFLQEAGVHEHINTYIDAYTLPSEKRIYSLCHGALVNFVAGGGNPSAVMSHTFTLTILAHIEFTKNASAYPTHEISPLPQNIENEAILLNYPELSNMLYTLSPAQREYLNLSSKDHH